MQNIWTLDQHRARLELPQLKAGLDLRHPEQGLHALEYGQSTLPAMLGILGVDPRCFAQTNADLTPSDAYVRRGDLVVSYAGSGGQPLLMQVYWRLVQDHADDLIEIDLEISVQTPLLDSDPALWTTSRLPAGQVLWLVDGQGAQFRDLAHSAAGQRQPPGCWLIRPEGQPWSYAEMVPPADFSANEASSTGETICLRQRLFVSRLEKGVILRARVRGVLLARADDDVRAAAAYGRLLASPPSLTT